MRNTIRLTRADALKIIESYCIDEPPAGALDRLTRADLTVDTDDRAGAVRIRGNLSVEQSVIDAILYPAK